MLRATGLAFCLCLAHTNASADDSSKEAAAEALIEATRIESMMAQMYAQIPQMIGGLLPQGPNAPTQEDMQKLMERTVGFIDERIGYQAMKPEYVAMYADAYSEEDLLALTEFMESPLGQRFLDATPELMAQASTMARQRMSEAMPELLEIVESELRALEAK